MSKNKKSTAAVIEASHYQENVNELKKCSIVLAMVSDVRKQKKSIIDAFINQEMMGTCNAEYERRGGKDNESLGAVGRAISELLLGR